MSITKVRRPVATLLMTPLALVALGFPATALGTDAPTISGWGSNYYGTITPPESLDGKTITAISAGDDHSLALTSDGKITAWGSDEHGQTDVPASLGDKTVTAISADGFHSVALTSDGKVTVWGWDVANELDVPASLDDKTVTAVVAGGYHSLALTSDGKVVAWGANDYGQSNVPASLDDETVTAIAASGYFSVALTADGKVVEWGDDSHHQTEVPASLAGETVTHIAAGSFHTLATTADGKVVAWGDNAYGETDVPSALDDQDVVALSAGGFHSVALTAEGRVYAWGADNEGQSDVPADLAHRRVSAISANNDHNLVLSTPREVAAFDGPVTVTGTPKLGQTLEGHATPVSPDETVTGQWLRDGEPIMGATGASYTLTGDDVSHLIAYRATASRGDYDPTTATSEPVGPVAKGTITLPAPTISGTPAVDHTLTGTVTGVDPEDAGLTYSWTRGDTVVGTDATYTPTAADEGHSLVLSVTATKANYDDNTSATSTPEIAGSSFSSGPSASISGTVQVGKTLTAGAGEVVPEADSLSYQWYADDEPIADATGDELVLTPAERHAAITVEVTAHRAGYADASDTSDPTAPVSSKAAPQLQLDASPKSVELGQSTVLSWSSDEADSLTASGGWSGQRSSESNESVTPAALGTTTYALSASNDQGTTTTQVAVEATPATKTIPLVSTVAGTSSKSVRVQAQGMYPHEAYSIRISHDELVTGEATAAGTIDRTVKRDTAASAGHTRVKLTGMAGNRSSYTYVRSSSDKSLDLMVNPRVTGTQQLKVSGLAPNEKIDITYRGEQLVAPETARADKDGDYQLLFPVGSEPGQRRVSVRGLFSTRTATATFTVAPSK